MIAEEYPASAEIIALYYFNSYDLLYHVQGSTKVISPFNQWGPICSVVQGVHFLPWGPLSRRPTGYTAQQDQSCFHTSCQQNLKNMISPLMDLIFSVVVASANAPGLCLYVQPQFPKHSFLARISHSFCWNQLSIIQALIMGLGVQASLPFPSWQDSPCRPFQSLRENSNPQRVGTVSLSMFPKAPSSSCKFAHLLLKIPCGTGRAYFNRPKTKQLQK